MTDAELAAEVERLRAELEQVKAARKSDRDDVASALNDLAIGDVGDAEMTLNVLLSSLERAVGGAS